MPASDEAVPFQMLSDKGSQPSSVDAVLTVTRASDYSRRSGWKAVMSFRDQGKRKRTFGALRFIIVDAVQELLDRFVLRLSKSEMLRLQNVAAAIQERRAANLPTCAMGSQPRQASDPAPQPRNASGSESRAPSQASCPENAVCYVHQNFGLFGDDKPMSNFFQTSNRMWKEVAAGMGEQYHLWNAAEVESLVKQRYPQFLGHVLWRAIPNYACRHRPLGCSSQLRWAVC